MLHASTHHTGSPYLCKHSVLISISCKWPILVVYLSGYSSSSHLPTLLHLSISSCASRSSLLNISASKYEGATTVAEETKLVFAITHTSPYPSNRILKEDTVSAFYPYKRSALG